MTTSSYFLLPLLLFVIGYAVQQPPKPLSPENPLNEEARAWVDRTLQSMTLEQKVGQVIFPVTYTASADLRGAPYQEVVRNVTKYHVGGYLAFRGEVSSATDLIRQMQEKAKIPLLLTADLEGGAGLVLRGATRFPKAMAIGATYDTNSAYQTGRVTALEARAVGIHVNFYPVVDVNNNPRNPIINIRSFGEDPARVADMARAYIQGSQEQGVLATAKHFPGHGDTATDSHLDLPVITVARDRLESIELPPFRAAIDAGVGAVMTAHLFIPSLEPQEGVPATLSSAILTDLLKKQLCFAGLVFTDAMNMGGIVKKFKNGDAAARAFKAGADVILFPPSVPDAYMGLLDAAKGGEITEARLNQSVRKILETKARLGLYQGRQPDQAKPARTVGATENRRIAQDIMDRAVTLVRDEKNVLPFRDVQQDQQILLLTMLDSRRRQETRGAALVRNIRERHSRTVHHEILAGTPAAKIKLVQTLARQADLIVVGTYIRVGAFKGSIDLSPTQLDLLQTLSKLDKPFAFVLFGSPYLLSFVPELPSYVLTYEDYPGAELAAAKAIMGEIPFRGRLPVSLPELYPAGHGIHK
ncbi:MAG: hypothetical protein EHM23_04990 [Acidobacteria bacterium]|nr:MAG: hypothetical protein EHM23_04990 [Acidobacteriota bacterium]